MSVKVNSDAYEFITQLVEGVRNNRCLYDKSDVFYFNKSKRNEAWMEIAHECNKTSIECKNKWKAIRERYSREVRKSNNPGTGTAESNEWSLFGELQFLKHSITQREKRKPDKKVKQEKEDTENDEEYEETTQDEPQIDGLDYLSEESLPTPSHVSTIQKKRKTTDFDGYCDQFMKIVKKLENEVGSSIDNSVDCSRDGDVEFFSAIHALMRDLPIDAKDTFKADMMTRVMQLRKDYRRNDT